MYIGTIPPFVAASLLSVDLVSNLLTGMLTLRMYISVYKLPIYYLISNIYIYIYIHITLTIGTIPTSWCSSVTTLSVDQNTGLCYEASACYTSVAAYSAFDVPICVSDRDQALCAFVAATWVSNAAPDWICDTDGLTTNLCSTGWTGVVCGVTGGVVDSIVLTDGAFIGKHAI